MTAGQAYFRTLALATIVAGGLFSGFPSYAQQMTKAEQAANEKMAEAYSHHLFISMCAQNYRNEFPVNTLSSADKAQVNAHTQGACECLYDRVSKDTEPDEVTNYVMYTYGPQSVNGKPDPEALQYYGSKEVQKIGVFWRDKPLLKKCGFSRKIDGLK